jgi:hypothetical protein
MIWPRSNGGISPITGRAYPPGTHRKQPPLNLARDALRPGVVPRDVDDVGQRLVRVDLGDQYSVAVRVEHAGGAGRVSGEDLAELAQCVAVASELALA